MTFWYKIALAQLQKDINKYRKLNIEALNPLKSSFTFEISKKNWAVLILTHKPILKKADSNNNKLSMFYRVKNIFL